jgi:hypothetical protein
MSRSTSQHPGWLPVGEQLHMKQFLREFQKIKSTYEKADSGKSGLVCVTGVFEECPYVRLHRESWLCRPAEIFFSVWTDKDSERSGRLHYNIHAFKLREFKFHVITSRNFADSFRKAFKTLAKSWPNVRIDYGPLNLMEGWVEYRETSFESDVLGLMNQFSGIAPVIDRLLEERIAPVRPRR